MDKHTQLIKKRYNRISRIYDLMESPMEMMSLKKWRIELMRDLQGKVLEVGVGTGKNIEFYPDSLEITAIDFSERMLEKARQKAEIYKKKVNLMEMDAQYMRFPDNSFDTVFTTCVFCSVPDPIKGLKEMGRVCKAGGRIIMIEHVRSEKKVLGTIMDVLNPVVVNLYGANINRRTVENVKVSGLLNIEVIDLSGDIVKKIIIYNNK
ncbi:MAG: methyltransferase type 11 [Clostridia bacterium BRH_c25]|nr:MAG: methyltransferase type 11 [Clostridia bacterium BRH_c25]